MGSEKKLTVDVTEMITDEIQRCEANAKTWAHCKCATCQGMAKAFRARADRLRDKLKGL